MKKFFLYLLLIIFLALAGGIFYLGYLGFVPGIASIFGSDKPRDLGVTYTQQDYINADDKAQVEIKVSQGQVAPEDSMVLAGEKPVNENFSDNELTAVINKHQGNWRYYPVSDVQVLIGDNGQSQVSGMMHLDRLAGYAAATGASYADIQTVMSKFKLLPDKVPFYVSCTASVTNNIVSMNIDQAELGRAKIPQNMINENAGAVNAFFTQQLSAFTGLNVESMTLGNGEMSFDGTLPESVETYQD